MLRSLLCCLLLLPALALAPGCGGEPPAVATVEVESSELELPPRHFATVELSWRLQEPLAGQTGPLHVFVHLLDGPGSVVRTFDYPWPDGWRVGKRVAYRLNLHQSALAPPLDPGLYALTLGLYDGEGRRWPLVTRGELVDRHEYRVANVRVPAESAGGPVFQFSPEWLDSEPGRDRQVLARRWLTGPGRLRIGGLEGAGQVLLRLLLPTASGEQELVLAEGASQQGAMVGSTCGDVEVRLAGPGSHDVVLPITPVDDGDSCDVEITPNFYLLELQSGKRRAVSLDVLAWSAQ